MESPTTTVTVTYEEAEAPTPWTVRVDGRAVARYANDLQSLAEDYAESLRTIA
ncbi:MAG: hypothetical protein AAGA90_23560 [Actinomycetota bacterium]